MPRLRDHLGRCLRRAFSRRRQTFVDRAAWRQRHPLRVDFENDRARSAGRLDSAGNLSSGSEAAEDHPVSVEYHSIRTGRCEFPRCRWLRPPPAPHPAALRPAMRPHPPGGRPTFPEKLPREPSGGRLRAVVRNAGRLRFRELHRGCRGQGDQSGGGHAFLAVRGLEKLLPLELRVADSRSGHAPWRPSPLWGNSQAGVRRQTDHPPTKKPAGGDGGPGVGGTPHYWGGELLAGSRDRTR